MRTTNATIGTINSSLTKTLPGFTVQTEAVADNADVSNHTITYEVYSGSETPERTMILCHGASCTRHTMKVLAAELVKHRPQDRLIIMDVPWHGESMSDGPIDYTTVHTYADVLQNFVQQLRENGTIQGSLAWFGWSMGGSIGMLLELNGVDIDELVLINTSPVWETIQGMLATIPALSDPNQISDVFRLVMAEDMAVGTNEAERDGIIAQFADIVSEPHVMINDFAGLKPDKYDIRDRLQNIQAKTVIVSGSQDNLATTEMQQVMIEQIPHAIAYISDGSHADVLKQHGAAIIASCFIEVCCYDADENE